MLVHKKKIEGNIVLLYIMGDTHIRGFEKIIGLLFTWTGKVHSYGLFIHVFYIVFSCFYMSKKAILLEHAIYFLEGRTQIPTPLSLFMHFL